MFDPTSRPVRACQAGGRIKSHASLYLFSRCCTLNKKQRRAIWIGTFLIVLMGLIPPLTYDRRCATNYRPSYGPIFNLPECARLDLSRLLIQWFLVVVVIGAVLMTTKNHVMDDVAGQPAKRIMDHVLDILQVALALGCIGFAIALGYAAWAEQEVGSNLVGAVISGAVGCWLMWSFWKNT